jgi:hypothetical protein
MWYLFACCFAYDKDRQKIKTANLQLQLIGGLTPNERLIAG